MACDSDKAPETDTQGTVQTDTVTPEGTTDTPVGDTEEPADPTLDEVGSDMQPAEPTTDGLDRTDTEPEDPSAEPTESNPTSEHCESDLLGSETAPEESEEDSETVDGTATEELTEAVTEDTAETSNAIPTETPSEADTQPEDPEETKPGKLIYVSNDELCYLDNMGEEIGCAYEPGEYVNWEKRALTVGKDQVAVFMDRGWVAFDSVNYKFGYIVNGESFFSETYSLEAEDAVVKLATQMGAKNCARFCGGLTVEALQMGTNTVQFCVILDGGVLCYLREYTVTLTQNPVRLDGTYWSVEMERWEVSGHKPGITSASDPSHGGMVRAGGVDEAALLHQGAIGIGTVDLSKYSKVIIYYGCDNSGVTQSHYDSSPHNRIMLSRVDTDLQNSPAPADVIASATYTLMGWTPYALEIDLTGINYNGPVYITVDTLPGTFMLITAIEFIGAGKNEGSGGNDTPTPPSPPAQGSYVPDLHDWEVSGHKKGITSASDPTHGAMVRAGGVTEAALLHQGAIGIGTVDLSKYSKVIIHYGCDNSATTQNYYNNSPHNRIMLSRADTDQQISPAEADIIAFETYTLYGWTPYGLEIDLSGINYNGPVYITMDTLPGTFMLITAIEFVK